MKTENGNAIQVEAVIKRNHSKDSAIAAAKKTTQINQRGTIRNDAKKLITKRRWL